MWPRQWAWEGCSARQHSWLLSRWSHLLAVVHVTTCSQWLEEGKELVRERYTKEVEGWRERQEDDKDGQRGGKRKEKEEGGKKEEGKEGGWREGGRREGRNRKGRRKVKCWHFPFSISRVSTLLIIVI